MTLTGDHAKHEIVQRTAAKRTPKEDREYLAAVADGLIEVMRLQGLNVREGICVAGFMRWRLIEALLEDGLEDL